MRSWKFAACLLSLAVAGCSQMGHDEASSPLPQAGGNGALSQVRQTSRAACGTSAPMHARCYVRVSPIAMAGGRALPPPAGFYGPSDIQSMYKLPSSTRGKGVTVAIVDAYDDPNAESDLAVYRSNYGLPACTTSSGCFAKVNQNGQSSPLPAGDQNWGFEISLDIQMVSAVCPNCHILLVEANSNGFGDLLTGVDAAVGLHAHIVSTSWGTGEFSGENGYDTHFNVAGVMFTNSSGDGGYSGGTQYPAASPYVTAVGGTIPLQASNKRGWTETAWSGSGSGCSLYESKPSWQTDSGCSHRTIADVSAVADSVAGYDTYTGSPGWYSFSGTSVSSPIIASVYALAGNASKLTFGSSSYSRVDAAGLFDIRKGSTGTCTPAYLCTAVEDYDGPTGNGTPQGVTAF